MQKTPFTIQDFSGGRTDKYIDGPLNSYTVCDNLIPIKHNANVGKLQTRGGSEIYDEDYPQISSAADRTGFLKYFESQVLAHMKRRLYRLSASGWTEFTGPSSNPAFLSTAAVTDVAMNTVWNRHLFISNDNFSPILKIYPNASNVLTMRTAGLPTLASSPTITPGANTGKTFLYRFCHAYTYSVGTVSFIDRGSLTDVTVGNADAPQTNANAITAIPVLANGTDYNWDTSTIKIEIYRTINNGTTYYKVGEVTNGTTTFNDNVSDAALVSNLLLYTEGGVPDNDIPPRAKVVHVVQDVNVALYGHTKDPVTSTIYNNRVRQSVPNDPDSCPESFYTDVGDEIVGISDYKGRPIILCKDSIYRIDGFFDSLGRGGMFATVISNTATCASAQSVVQTLVGVFWAGRDGYYWSDGYDVQKINDDWVDTYLERVSDSTRQKRIQGKFDKRGHRILWTIHDDDSTVSDCNRLDVLSLDFGIRENSTFTSISGGSTFSASSIEFVDSTMLRGDRNGYVFAHRDSLTTDKTVDILVTPADWEDETIFYDYTSCAFNFDRFDIEKQATEILVKAQSTTNLSLQITSINDDSRVVEDLQPIRYRGNIVWGDPDIVWGDEALFWNKKGIIDSRRRFPSRSLRCSYKQIQLTNARVAISSSDQLGPVTVNSTSETATFVGAYTWLSDVLDYTISFEADNYVQEFAISARTSDTVLTLNPTANQGLPNGVNKWVIRGYPKGETLYLLSYTIDFENLGRTQDPYLSALNGEVQS